MTIRLVVFHRKRCVGANASRSDEESKRGEREGEGEGEKENVSNFVK